MMLRYNTLDDASSRSRGPVAPLVAAALVAVVAACEQPLNTPVAQDELQEMTADQVIFGMTSFLTSNGIREGRVEADTAYMYADSSVAQLRQMEITFYDTEGRPTATVTGLRGRMSQQSDAMVAQGDVVLFVFADSSTIESQEIHYDPELDRIWSDSTTVQTMKDGTVTSGTAFESDIAFENIVVENPRGGRRRVF